MFDPPTSLTLLKLAVLLLGLFNLFLTLRGFPQSLHQTITQPRRIWIHDPTHPQHDFQVLQLDVPDTPRTLFTEETVHYPIQGPRAESEWGTLVPEHLHGLVRLHPGSDTDGDGDTGLYAVSMFHTLHCLDRIRQAIIAPDDAETHTEAQAAQIRHHVHHCFNYIRQMILCAANTRLNPTNHVQPSGRLAADGIGLMYRCRDWDAVYDTFDRISGTNWTAST